MRASQRRSVRSARARLLPTLVVVVAALTACSGPADDMPETRTDGASLSAAAPEVGVDTSSAVATASGSSSIEQSAAPPATTSVAATRWWSDSAAPAGGIIDAQHPTRAAAGLTTSRSEYCSVLKQTLDAGSSILPGVSAHDPAFLTSTKAFIATVRRLAPTVIAPDWATVGDAVLALVPSGGKSLGRVSAKELASASAAITDDARTACHLDLGTTPG